MSESPTQAEKAAQMERVSVETLAKHFSVSVEVARKAQDAVGFMYRERATSDCPQAPLQSPPTNNNLYACARAVLNHWEEFGPEFGLDEAMHHLRLALYPALSREESNG